MEISLTPTPQEADYILSSHFRKKIIKRKGFYDVQ